MRILVAIAYHGTTNEPFVRRLLDEYSAMSFDVDVVVLSEAPKELTGCEVRVGLPIDDPYSLPFAYRPLFEERRNDYDLYVYSEDDTLIGQRAIEAFVWASSVLPRDVVAGFLRTETTAEGKLRCSSMHSRFHWDPTSTLNVAGETFAEFTNEHGAAFILTRDQLAIAMSSPAWSAPPHETLRHDMRVMAAVHPYVNCGLTKLMCVTRLDEFLLPHLSNRYVTSELGVPLEEFKEQAAVLADIAVGSVSSRQLVTPTASVADPRWDATYWPQPDHASLAALPPNATSVLSFGVGSGVTESALIERGMRVVGIPLDNVTATSARRRGLQTTAPDLALAIDELGGEQLDALLMLDILHHVADPVAALRSLHRVLRPGARAVATFPNVRREQIGSALRKAKLPQLNSSFAETNVHFTTPHLAARWFRSAGYVDVTVSYPSSGRKTLSRLLSPAFRVEATSPGRITNQLSAATPQTGTPQMGDERPPRVTIGLPVYNGAQYLRAAIDSLLSQSFEDFELVICDNASTDSTAQICKEYAAIDKRVRYERQPRNLGAASNYNRTFELGRGEFFKWAAHDDLCRPDFIRRCVQEFDSDHTGDLVLVHPRALLIDDRGDPIRLDTDDVALLDEDPVRRFGHVMRHVSAANAVFGVFPRRVLERTALIAPHEASDWTLLAELALHGRFRCVDEVLFERRIHDGASLRAIILQGGKRRATLNWWDTDRVTLRGMVPFSVRTSYALFRAAGRAPLTRRERMRARLAVPRNYWPRLARFHAGRLKKRISGESVNKPAAIERDDSTVAKST